MPQTAVVHQARKASSVLEFCALTIVNRRQEIMADSRQVSIIHREQ
ncbi:MAG: hypothetical protein H6Q72_2022 [Firmicutes bacterium]|nr:hypothetical protein [Bacillota bacterium]